MKRKLRIDRIVIFLIISIVLFLIIFNIFKPKSEKVNKMIDLSNYSIEDIEKYTSDNKLNLIVKEEYNKIKRGSVVSQSIEKDKILTENEDLVIVISKGIDYKELNVDELGNVPIMMYHGIHNVTDNEYTGGNVDKDGYQRTSSAFRKDLEFYYQSGYRMIRLNDYVNGIIDVSAGYSPIIITFDDGLSNNIKVTGLDDKGNIIIDPNSAVGILEEFKKK